MFKSYVHNEQFNLQINRFINDYYQEDDRAQADLEKMIPKLKDTHSWYEAWLNFAREREDSKDYDLASVYYQAAEFYLATTDPNKEKCIENIEIPSIKAFMILIMNPTKFHMKIPIFLL